MLLSSILQILDQRQAQPKVVEKADVVEKFELDTSLMAENARVPAKADMDSPAAKPLDEIPQPPATFSTGQSVEELIRAVTKFEKSEQSRVVDVFE